MRVGSLFSGIGGIDLGLERAGYTIAWQCEIDPFCRRVLAKHWPDVRRYEDVHRVHLEDSVYCPGDGLLPARVGCRNCLESVDLICGGFPCQPVSLAGKRQGQDDARWLWPEFARIVRELRPRYVLVENVPGLLVRGMGDVLGDLAACGYDAEWDCIPAAAVGAPHRRDRVWIVGYPAGDRPGAGAETARRQTGDLAAREGWPDVADADGAANRCRGHDPATVQRLGWQTSLVRGSVSRSSDVAAADASGRDGRPWIFGQGRRPQPADGNWWAAEPDVGRVAHGVPARVDRLRSLGNAVVPQVVEYIGRRILEVDRG